MDILSVISFGWHLNVFLASPSFVWKNGRISGIVTWAINFTPSTQLWVLLNTIKFALAVSDY